MSNTKHNLNAETVLRSFPLVLAEDINLYALGAAISELAARHEAVIDRINIYVHLLDRPVYLRTRDGRRIRTVDGRLLGVRRNKVPDGLLDILAYDFKIDWWDADYSVEEKRKVIRDSWRIHRMLGTKGAVEQAISAIYPNTTVEEWFEYGGEPYHFRILLDVTSDSVNSTKHQRVIDRIEYYKNVRSVLDDIEYAAGDTSPAYACVASLGEEIEDGATAYIYS